MSLDRKYLEYLGFSTYMTHSVSSPFHSCFLVPKFYGTLRSRVRNFGSIGDRVLSEISQVMLFSFLNDSDMQIPYLQCAPLKLQLLSVSEFTF